MRAITTKYLGPTDRRGSRIKASDGEGNTATVSYAYDMRQEEAHFQAAKALCEKMDWHGDMIGGYLPNGYVFVFESPWNKYIV